MCGTGLLNRFWRRSGMRASIHIRLSTLAFVIFVSLLAWASITGTVSGVVTDSSGAVIPNAQVVAIDTQTGVRTTVTTDAKGFYSFPSLPVGNYDLEITQVGFKTFRQTGLVINANSA